MWTSSPFYKHDIDIIRNLSVVNDACERALAMATSLHGPSTPKSEEQLQATYKLVDAIRRMQGSIANSTERVSKKTLAEFLNSSMIQV